MHQAAVSPTMKRRVPFGRLTAMALTLAAASTAGVALTNTDRLVARGFTAALDRAAPGGIESAATNVTRVATAPVSGTEDFWLSSNHAAGVTTELTLASWSSPMRIGARISVAIAGEERALEVIDIVELARDVTRVGTSTTVPRLAIVTLREAGKPSAPLIRWVVSPTEDGGATVVSRTS